MDGWNENQVEGEEPAVRWSGWAEGPPSLKQMTGKETGE